MSVPCTGKESVGAWPSPKSIKRLAISVSSIPLLSFGLRHSQGLARDRKASRTCVGDTVLIFE